MRVDLILQRDGLRSAVEIKYLILEGYIQKDLIDVAVNLQSLQSEGLVSHLLATPPPLQQRALSLLDIQRAPSSVRATQSQAIQHLVLLKSLSSD